MKDSISFKELLKKEKKFISTGSLLLDLALGGGILRGSIFNLIGDESTGKTLLGISAGVETQKAGGYLVYDDAEGTLDIHRAVKVFKLDPERAIYRKDRTVEALYKGLMDAIIRNSKEKTFNLYVLDSLDALHTNISASIVEKATEEAKKKGIEVEELDVSMRDKLDKSAMMSWLFSVLCGELKDNDVTFFIISQLRMKVGVMFGEKEDVSGGKALKFYSSQRVRLYEVGKIKKGDTIVGVKIRAKVKKNKVDAPFREAEFPIYFDKGIGEIESWIDFLRENSDLVGTKNNFFYRRKSFKSKSSFIEFLENDKSAREDVKKMVINVWKAVNKIGEV
ncbi:MAG: hypothetical protein QXZ43_04455 [Candidatus Aenigmatarchaeota archaeon]